MTTWTNPPAILTQLRTQLVACSSWANGSNAVNYPELAALMSGTFPLAVLAEMSRRAEVFSEGAAALASGELQVVIYSTGTIGTAEALGRSILEELLAQATGIPFRSGDCGLSSDPSPGMIAGSSDVRAVTLSLPWGLTA